MLRHPEGCCYVWTRLIPNKGSVKPTSITTSRWLTDQDALKTNLQHTACKCSDYNRGAKLWLESNLLNWSVLSLNHTNVNTTSINCNRRIIRCFFLSRNKCQLTIKIFNHRPFNGKNNGPKMNHLLQDRKQKKQKLSVLQKLFSWTADWI